MGSISKQVAQHSCWGCAACFLIYYGKGRTRPVEHRAKRTAGAANHYWDEEYLQFALVHSARVDLLPAQLRAKVAVRPPNNTGIRPANGQPFQIARR